MRTISDFQQFPDFHNHKVVIEISRPEVSLRGFIAIHNTVLGPAVGGTRMYPYKSEKEAITDVLRLSHAMTYKCALAGVPFGGGKGVIVGDPNKHKTPELLKAYAEEIDQLKGKFFTGEDVGMLEEDIAFMLRYSKYFIGRSDQAGDPSPYAGLSTFVALEAAAQSIFGSKNLSGKIIAVKGVGKVGSSIVELLVKAGAKVLISDIDVKAIEKITSKYPSVIVVDNDQIHTQQCDIYVPCALGKEITESNIDRIKAKLICGAANNQLENARVGESLYKRGIVFIPDYVANAGGLINVVDELHEAGYDAARVRKSIEGINDLVIEILKRSKEYSMPTNIVADSMAEEVLTRSKKNIS